MLVYLCDVVHLLSPSGKSRMPSYSSPPATPHTSTISPQSGHDSEGDSGHPSSPDEFLSVSKTTPTHPPHPHTTTIHIVTINLYILPPSLPHPQNHKLCTHKYSRMPVVKRVLVVCSHLSLMMAWTPTCPC